MTCVRVRLRRRSASCAPKRERSMQWRSIADDPAEARASRWAFRRGSSSTRPVRFNRPATIWRALHWTSARTGSTSPMRAITCMGFEAALDPIARRKGLVARAGASSTPAVSTAVVEDLTRHWQRLDSVDIAIMPGGAGRRRHGCHSRHTFLRRNPIETYREGARAEVTGWGSAQRTCVPEPACGIFRRLRLPTRRCCRSASPSRRALRFMPGSNRVSNSSVCCSSPS